MNSLIEKISNKEKLLTLMGLLGFAAVICTGDIVATDISPEPAPIHEIQAQPSESTGVLYFGPFWQYDINPAQTAAGLMENEDSIANTEYKMIPVDYEKIVNQIENYTTETKSNLVVILAVGGSSKNTYVETSAGNRWPDPLPQGRIIDPYTISTKNMPIYPNEPLNKVKKISPLLITKMQEFIDAEGWQNISLSDNGPNDENNSPCNAALYALLKACEQDGRKECFLVHLPMDPKVLPVATEKITALLKHLSNQRGEEISHVIEFKPE